MPVYAFVYIYMHVYIFMYVPIYVLCVCMFPGLYFISHYFLMKYLKWYHKYSIN